MVFYKTEKREGELEQNVSFLCEIFDATFDKILLTSGAVGRPACERFFAVNCFSFVNGYQVSASQAYLVGLLNDLIRFDSSS